MNLEENLSDMKQELRLIGKKEYTKNPQTAGVSSGDLGCCLGFRIAWVQVLTRFPVLAPCSVHPSRQRSWFKYFSLKGDPEWVSGSYLQLFPAPAIVGIWKVNQWMENPCLTRSAFQHKEIKREFDRHQDVLISVFLVIEQPGERVWWKEERGKGRGKSRLLSLNWRDHRKDVYRGVVWLW